MYIDYLHVDPRPVPCVLSSMCFRVWLAFSHPRYATALLHFSNCPPLIAIRLSPHHPPPVGYWVVRHLSMSILYSLRPYFPSFETTQKHTDLFSPNAPSKVLFLPFTSLPAPSPFTPCRPYPILRSHGFTLHISVRLPVMYCPTFVTDTYEFFSTVVLSHR